MRSKHGSKKTIRPVGKVTSDLEPLWFELVDDHKMQVHEVVGMFWAWAAVHYPEAIEVYEDGTSPVPYLNRRGS